MWTLRGVSITHTQCLHCLFSPLHYDFRLCKSVHYHPRQRHSILYCSLSNEWRGSHNSYVKGCCHTCFGKLSPAVNMRLRVSKSFTQSGKSLLPGLGLVFNITASSPTLIVYTSPSATLSARCAPSPTSGKGAVRL